MEIGITYDLRQDYLKRGYDLEETAEFDKPETIDAIEQALVELGHHPVRIGNAEDLVAALAAGGRWDLVFNIAEGLRGFGRESLVPSLLDAYGIPYTFSDPCVLGLTLHKGLCKHAVRDMGIPTADFFVVQAIDDLARAPALPYPLFAKPVAEGTSKGIDTSSVIATPGQLHQTCATLLQRFGQPVLVERFLPGREFTVGIVGTGAEARVVGILEVLFRDGVEGVYSYDNKEHYEERIRYALLDDAELSATAEAMALNVWRALGCRDAGRVDLRADDDGDLLFLEINPLAGLNPVHSDLPILCRLRGWSYMQLMEQILGSALTRCQPHARRRAA